MIFAEEYDFLSNFYPANVYGYPTVEHAFQAAKTCDVELRRKIRRAAAPRIAKRRGRRLILRPDWEEIKLEVMETLVRRKFENAILKDKLATTGEKHLVEDNIWHDNFWGDCLCKQCENIVGENHLGKILMKIRDEIKRG